MVNEKKKYTNGKKQPLQISKKNFDTEFIFVINFLYTHTPARPPAQIFGGEYENQSKWCVCECVPFALKRIIIMDKRERKKTL